MRVLHIYKDYYPVLGGIENHLRLLAEGQAQRGLEVTVLVTNLTGRTTTEEMGGVKVIKAARLATLASTPLSLSLPLTLCHLDADIAHLHFPYPLGELSQLLFGKSRRTIITYHSDIVRQRGLLRLYEPFLWRVLARADRIIATSPPYMESSPYLRRVRDKCVVIPLGVDLSFFQKPRPEEVRALRERFTPPLLLFVGRLRYYKGVGFLLQAMKEVKATLLVVGTGPMEGPWRSLAQSLGQGKKVLFAGEIGDEELPAYYQACDIFVLPASERSEAFGAVQVEAMACGKPVISTDLGTGTSYVNVDGRTGLVVPPRDPAALALATDRLLGDPALRERMGKEAKERAEEFSLEKMLDRTLALYEEVLT